MSRGSSLRFMLLFATVPLASMSMGACKSGGDTDGGAGHGGGGGEVILDPSTEHFGRSNAEWAARFWQWVYEMPHESDDECMAPQFDPTGANCTYGQSGEVFFLAGSFGGETLVREECVVPEGKAIFIPIASLSGDNGGVPLDMQLSAEELETLVQGWVDDLPVDEITLEFDGVEIDDMERFKTSVTQYSYDVPHEPNTYSACLGGTGVEGTVEPAFAAGYSVMLASPEPGDHVVHFTAPGTGLGPPIDVTYEFTVE